MRDGARTAAYNASWEAWDFLDGYKQDGYKQTR
jgi:hypothetical protein